ncbi:MAG: deoxyribodipyrimidine photolyase [Bacteroidetes bacterium GWE2_41_25]|nr:MAG: deoxyribodipyrimidine photolyase [Bacteroidetes bacterium GWE2_41_25]
MSRMKINLLWFRRDLRLYDNTALANALEAGLPVLPVFIFDTNITSELHSDDPRVNFIHETLEKINLDLNRTGSSLYVLKDEPENAWKKLIASFDINEVYINKDYEPYAISRDNRIRTILDQHNIGRNICKDQVIFEENEIVKSDGKPYTVYTPYKNRWLQKLHSEPIRKTTDPEVQPDNFHQCNYPFPSLKEIGFKRSAVKVRPYDLSVINDYHKYRDLPAADKTSYLSPHLRFGTIGIRDLVKTAMEQNQVFLSELIWREFFMQILFHYPKVVTESFRTKYDNIKWRNDEKEFERWCNGETGIPIVDAGMRQLNSTGYMHNRVRMITAGFLCKHLLIDWRWGEAYFAKKLLDYELSSNNGNWQWAAGTGCDAAPFFRIFNPWTQQKKFDPDREYIRKWVPETGRSAYPGPMVEHDFARRRALETYKAGLKFHL